MDFIAGLSKSHGKTILQVVIDRWIKYAHFLVLSDPTKVASFFVDNIVKFHGWLTQIITNRDPIFMSVFWNDLFMELSYWNPLFFILRQMGNLSLK